MKKIISLFVFAILAVLAFSQQATYLNGISDTSLVNKIAILYSSPFVDTDFNSVRYKSLKKDDNNRFYELLSLNTFRTGKIEGLLSGSQKIFITAGDSVFFITDTTTYKDRSNSKRIVFKFSGKNAAHYNYGYLSEQEFYPPFRKGDDLMAYKDTLSAIMKSKYDFLEAYRQEFPVSEAFYDYAKADILNEYIRQLYLPLISGSGKVEMKQLPVGYFDNTLRPVNELSSEYAYAVLYRYFEFYSDHIWSDLDEMYTYIKKDFFGKEREYLISALIGFFSAAQKPDYRQRLQKIIKESPQYVSDSLYLDYIDKAAIFYSLINNPFPENVRLNTFLKEFGQDKVISLDELLQKYEGKPVYIDFWASWCGPCRGNIEDSQEAKVYLKEKGVEFIYIAFRDEEKAWEKASKELDITTNQYLLLDSKVSPLYSYLKISGIPRYLVLDANHLIINGKAPRPIPASFDDFKRSIENCFKKEVFFY